LKLWFYKTALNINETPVQKVVYLLIINVIKWNMLRKAQKKETMLKHSLSYYN